MCVSVTGACACAYSPSWSASAQQVTASRSGMWKEAQTGCRHRSSRASAILPRPFRIPSSRTYSPIPSTLHSHGSLFPVQIIHTASPNAVTGRFWTVHLNSQYSPFTRLIISSTNHSHGSLFYHKIMLPVFSSLIEGISMESNLQNLQTRRANV